MRRFAFLCVVLLILNTGARAQPQGPAVGGRYEIHARIAHTLANRGAEDCQFLLLQGVGRYEWIKADG